MSDCLSVPTANFERDRRDAKRWRYVRKHAASIKDVHISVVVRNGESFTEAVDKAIAQEDESDA